MIRIQGNKDPDAAKFVAAGAYPMMRKDVLERCRTCFSFGGNPASSGNRLTCSGEETGDAAARCLDWKPVKQEADKSLGRSPADALRAAQDAAAAHLMKGTNMSETTKNTKRQNLEQLLSAERTKNEALVRENERLNAKVLATEKLYETLSNTWNAVVAGAANGKSLSDFPMPIWQARGEVSRKLAMKILEFIDADGEKKGLTDDE